MIGWKFLGYVALCTHELPQLCSRVVSLVECGTLHSLGDCGRRWDFSSFSRVMGVLRLWLDCCGMFLGIFAIHVISLRCARFCVLLFVPCFPPVRQRRVLSRRWTAPWWAPGSGGMVLSTFLLGDCCPVSAIGGVDVSVIYDTRYDGNRGCTCFCLLGLLA